MHELSLKAIAEAGRRRLAVVAFLDVAGYSRLMGDDEYSTHRQWLAVRQDLIEPLLDVWHGRIVDRAGDGVLAEFRGALDAVHWAIEVQNRLVTETTFAPIRVRIALHLGDIADGPAGEIYGDGVNLAARLQAYGDPECIIVSRPLMDAVSGKVAIPILDLGELRLRNIPFPVHAFVMRPGRGPPGLPALLRTQPDPRPAIAVLPFRTEDREAETEVASFASGMVEGIIHFLSGLKELFVISYSAVHAVGGTAFDPQAAGRALGVRYVLDGSVRRHQARLRVTTRLSETETGGILHAERHDAALSDLFDLQDSIAAQVATTIAPHVHERELARATRKHPDSMSAYELVIQGIEWLHRLDQQSFSQARGLLQRAMATDPAYAPAFSHAAWWHTFRIAQGWSPEPANDAGEALRLSAIAGGLDRSDALALTIQGHTQGFLLRDYEGGLDLLTRALGFAPSNALAWAFSSAIHGYMDHGNEAVTHAEQALRLSPLGPFVFLHQMILAQAYYLNGELDNAVSWGRRAVAQNQRHAPALRVLAASLAASGRHVETHAVAQTILQLNPKFNLTDYARSTPLQGAIRQGFVDHLRKAGLPG